MAACIRFSEFLPACMLGKRRLKPIPRRMLENVKRDVPPGQIHPH